MLLTKKQTIFDQICWGSLSVLHNLIPHWRSLLWLQILILKHCEILWSFFIKVKRIFLVNLKAEKISYLNRFIFFFVALPCLHSYKNAIECKVQPNAVNPYEKTHLIQVVFVHSFAYWWICDLFNQHSAVTWQKKIVTLYLSNNCLLRDLGDTGCYCKNKNQPTIKLQEVLQQSTT